GSLMPPGLPAASHSRVSAPSGCRPKTDTPSRHVPKTKAPPPLLIASALRRSTPFKLASECVGSTSTMSRSAIPVGIATARLATPTSPAIKATRARAKAIIVPPPEVESLSMPYRHHRSGVNAKMRAAVGTIAPLRCTSGYQSPALKPEELSAQPRHVLVGRCDDHRIEVGCTWHLRHGWTDAGAGDMESLGPDRSRAEWPNA